MEVTEVIKNIAAVLGIIISAASVLALISKSFRNILGKIFKKYGKSDEVSKSIAEIKDMLEQHVESEKEFKEKITEMNDINLEFTKTQCRNIIKTIFYKYRDTKVLPLYEKKTLINVEELYIGRLRGNSFAALLLDEMRDWEIDYESTNPQDDSN